MQKAGIYLEKGYDKLTVGIKEVTVDFSAFATVFVVAFY